MPHVSIKHFPAPLTEERESELLTVISDAVVRAFNVTEGAVSISIEPVAPDAWDEQVYQPEIVNRAEFLRKKPNY